MENNIESQVEEINLVKWYILPLLKLNKSSYGVGNFLGSYISKDGWIVVKVKSLKTIQVAWNHHSTYHMHIEMEDYDLIVYSIPVEYIDDFHRFMKGQYSKFSFGAKNTIKRYSNVSKDSDIYMVLDKDPKLKERLEDSLGVRLDVEAELEDIPGDNNYITI